MRRVNNLLPNAICQHFQMFFISIFHANLWTWQIQALAQHPHSNEHTKKYKDDSTHTISTICWWIAIAQQEKEKKKTNSNNRQFNNLKVRFPHHFSLYILNVCVSFIRNEQMTPYIRLLANDFQALVKFNSNLVEQFEANKNRCTIIFYLLLSNKISTNFTSISSSFRTLNWEIPFEWTLNWI